ncbi:NAD-dependent epimerase/dehydratase family protein [Nannocystaceae bacterium ST9]
MHEVVFVTGGSGYVGQAILRRLGREGHELRALARSPQAAARVEAAGANAFHGDLHDAAALAAALAGASVVVHVAASLGEATRWAEHERTNVAGTRLLLDVARAAGVRRFIYISAASVVLDGDPIEGDEALPVVVDRATPYSASKAMAERLVLAANSPEFTALALRPPLIWGEGMHSLPDMIAAIRERRFVWIDAGDFPYSVCHVDNLAHAVALALVRGQGGRAYFVTDDELDSMRSFFTALFESQGVEAEAREVPYWLAATLGRVIGALFALVRPNAKPPLTLELVRMIGRKLSLSNARAKTELGYAPIVDRATGMAALRRSGPRGSAAGGD